MQSTERVEKTATVTRRRNAAIADSRVDVVFSADKTFHYKGDRVQAGSSGETLFIAGPGTSTFDLRLSSEVAGVVAFLDHPIQFLSPFRQPIPPPQGKVVQRVSAQQTLLHDMNNNQTGQPERLRFALTIIANGKIYGDDPILIDEPPS